MQFGSNHGVIQRPSASCDALQGLSETSKVRNSTQILRDSCLTESHQMRAPLCGEEKEKKTYELQSLNSLNPKLNLAFFVPYNP